MSLLGLLTNESEEQNMVRSLIGLLLLAVAAPSWAQKIETEAPNRNQVIQVHTALNHLTVIEADEPVVTVATGSDAFKVEWRGNKVFVEPTEPDQSTNLFIWTRSGRLNYELDPAGPVGSMDFAIDHPKPVAAPSLSKPEEKASAKAGVRDPAGNLTSLLHVQPVRDDQPRPEDNQVHVSVNDVFEQKGVLYFRYEIFNNTRGAYLSRTPTVLLLSSVHSSQSLFGRSNSQLSDRESKRLRVKAWVPLQVVDGKLRSISVAPGQDAAGVVAVRFTPSGVMPQVVRFEFPPDGRGAVTATLVL